MRKNKKINSEFRDFPKYYIKSEDRKNNIELELADYKIEKYRSVGAFCEKNIDNLKEGNVSGYTYKNNYTNCTKSELATTMSHLKAVGSAYKEGCQMAMIMGEDIDFTLVPYWEKSLYQIIDETPKDFDILVLCHSPSLSRFCYLVSFGGMKKMKKLFYTEGGYKFEKKGFYEKYYLE